MQENKRKLYLISIILSSGITIFTSKISSQIFSMFDPFILEKKQGIKQYEILIEDEETKKMETKYVYGPYKQKLLDEIAYQNSVQLEFQKEGIKYYTLNHQAKLYKILREKGIKYIEENIGNYIDSNLLEKEKYQLKKLTMNYLDISDIKYSKQNILENTFDSFYFLTLDYVLYNVILTYLINKLEKEQILERKLFS